MASASDVAAYILRSYTRGISTWQLQKLVYYSQAWHSVWRDEPLFEEPIEAWANGPVVRSLYAQHRGKFTVTGLPTGDADALTPGQRKSIERVLDAYGALNGRQLSVLTHSEKPWREARGDLPSTALSDAEITLSSMQSFYGALDADEDAQAVTDIAWSESI
jgi:uncharacterized phage-associated protein